MNQVVLHGHIALDDADVVDSDLGRLRRSAQKPEVADLGEVDPSCPDGLDQIDDSVREQLGVDAEKVTAEASFVDDLGADSLDVVELVMAFEEKFDVEIPDEAAEKIANVKDAVAFLESNASS